MAVGSRGSYTPLHTSTEYLNADRRPDRRLADEDSRIADRTAQTSSAYRPRVS